MNHTGEAARAKRPEPESTDSPEARRDHALLYDTSKLKPIFEFRSEAEAAAAVQPILAAFAVKAQVTSAPAEVEVLGPAWKEADRLNALVATLGGTQVSHQGHDILLAEAYDWHDAQPPLPRPARRRRAAERTLILAFGYEEAIGYCTDPAAVADKDGITALIRVVALAASLKHQGLSMHEKLDQLAQRYGVHVTSQPSFRVDNLSIITAAMQRLRDDLPTRLVDEAVRAADLAAGWNGLPPTDAVLLEGQWIRVVVRPSGTEPKLKCYLQAKLPVTFYVAPEVGVLVARPGMTYCPCR